MLMFTSKTVDRRGSCAVLHGERFQPFAPSCEHIGMGLEPGPST